MHFVNRSRNIAHRNKYLWYNEYLGVCFAQTKFKMYFIWSAQFQFLTHCPCFGRISNERCPRAFCDGDIIAEYNFQIIFYREGKYSAVLTISISWEPQRFTRGWKGIKVLSTTNLSEKTKVEIELLRKEHFYRVPFPSITKTHPNWFNERSFFFWEG